MVRRKIFKLLVLALLGTIIPLQAEPVPIEIRETSLLYKIIENHSYCVAAFDGNKIFIRPENIISTKKGLFVNVNGFEVYPLPLLQCSKNGHYIEGSFVQELLAAKNEQTKGPCPNCGVNTDWRGICHNPLCLFEGHKVF